MAAILGDRLELVARPADAGEVDETGETLEDNARLKARAVAAVADADALADDTGLEVEALGGAPGVRSARYAGDTATDADNVRRLLGELTGVTGEGRRARFRTVVVLHRRDGSELVAEGVVTGRIAEAPRGQGGFGYDPVFVPDEGDGRTFAEMSAADKNALSHRGRALRALLERLDPAAPDGPGGA
ncbi:MAG: RdgB/HAM1 family non-canonical purine NTP pyrophosphatase [Actinomyces sp.]|nr:MAG: RdgB/HAM1 family non-canonical purine NTP pyrophosphatase [Actinomyces sp.]